MRPDKLPATITYRGDFGLWWPDYDAGPEKCHAHVRHYLSDADVGASYCKKRKVCVQAGGHVGLWPIRLARQFEYVYTFEAEEALFACLERNVSGHQNIEAHRLALSSKDGAVMMSPRATAGSWRVDADGVVETPAVRIDSLPLRRCDLIVLDVEGHEADVLRGASATIDKFHPIVQVEVLPRSADEIRSELAGMGYGLVKRIHGDEVYAFRG